MIYFLIFIIFVVIAIAFFNQIVKNKKAEISEKVIWPYYAKKPITPSELILYHRLVEALPECIILAQVQLSRVLGVKKGFNTNEWNNRINRMSLDYLICLKDSTIVAAVELDDSSHEKASSVSRDTKKDKALTDAGIKIIRWHVKNIPDTKTIRNVIAG